tara:strand:- start:206 stop:409 length:204 start_codon:yes stop_codon:yes gene_type:complete
LAALLGLFRTNPGLTPKRIGLGKPTLQFGERFIRFARTMRGGVIDLKICDLLFSKFSLQKPAPRMDW